MKLRYQNLVLTGLPLVCQLAFVSVLVFQNISLEKAAAVELHAKKVLTSCDELRVLLFAGYLTLTSMRLAESQEFVSTLNDSRKKILSKIKNLKELTASDQDAIQPVKRYSDTILHIQSLCDEGQLSYLNRGSKSDFKSFLNEQEFFEELAVYSRRMTENIAEINAVYSPIVNEMKPEAARRRKALQQFLIGGVAFNVALTLFLAWSFGKNTVSRLEFLLSKISDFARGKTDSRPLSG
ncbi:MAG: hypothetical protein K2X27_11300, partial [Candidatus Obscuribacterales bacterium]|nr:hypothetical protein [Candidatus Obscuribacterales bacterium]